jgi:hypothetical protein
LEQELRDLEISADLEQKHPNLESCIEHWSKPSRTLEQEHHNANLLAGNTVSTSSRDHLDGLVRQRDHARKFLLDEDFRGKIFVTNKYKKNFTQRLPAYILEGVENDGVKIYF